MRLGAGSTAPSRTVGKRLRDWNWLSWHQSQKQPEPQAALPRTDGDGISSSRRPHSWPPCQNFVCGGGGRGVLKPIFDSTHW